MYKTSPIWPVQEIIYMSCGDYFVVGNRFFGFVLAKEAV